MRQTEKHKTSIDRFEFTVLFIFQFTRDKPLKWEEIQRRRKKNSTLFVWKACLSWKKNLWTKRNVWYGERKKCLEMMKKKMSLRIDRKKFKKNSEMEKKLEQKMFKRHIFEPAWNFWEWRCARKRETRQWLRDENHRVKSIYWFMKSVICVCVRPFCSRHFLSLFVRSVLLSLPVNMWYGGRVHIWARQPTTNH